MKFDKSFFHLFAILAHSYQVALAYPRCHIGEILDQSFILQSDQGNYNFER